MNFLALNKKVWITCSFQISGNRGHDQNYELMNTNFPSGGACGRRSGATAGDSASGRGGPQDEDRGGDRGP
jgi:hypothetical protein